MLLAELTKEQIKERFNALPENIQKAFLSPGISEEVWRIAQLNHLSREKTALLAKIAGRVFLGFLDIDDVANAIRDNIGIPPELAGSLARELRRKIFSFYEADIIKAYSPVGEGKVVAEEAKEKPAIRPTTPVKIAPQGEKAAPVPEEKLETRAEPKKISPLVMTERGAAIPAPAPLPGEQKPGPVPATSKTAPQPSTPFILHKEEKIAPLSETKSVSSFEARIAPSPQKEEPHPLISAELEIGEEAQTIGTKKPPAIAKTEIIAPRTVHYSEFRTPLDPFRPQPAAPSQTSTPEKVSLKPEPSPSTLPQSPELWPKATPEPGMQEKPASPPRIAPSPQVKIEGNTVDLRQGQK